MNRYLNIFGFSQSEKTLAEAELIKAQAMADLASKPAERVSPLLYIIPIIGILTIGGIILYKKTRK